MNSKKQIIKQIVTKIYTDKIINYQQEYPKSKTLRQIIKRNKRIQENQEEKQVFKLAVKLAYDLDKICDPDKTGYVKKDKEKEYWLKISRELFDNTLGPKEAK
jgi:hypothetical protein